MKNWYQSKTFWVGALEIAIGIAGIVADFLGKGDYSPQAFMLLLVGVLTVALRFATKEPII